jgi:hypothetical protein
MNIFHILNIYKHVKSANVWSYISKSNVVGICKPTSEKYAQNLDYWFYNY